MRTRRSLVTRWAASLTRGVIALGRRHPDAGDAALAVALLAAAVVSLNATFELMRQDPAFHDPADKPLIIASLLVVIAPLALRRRFPLVVASIVVVAFVTGRLLLSPGVPVLPGWEGTITVWACWLALYTAVAHRRGTASSVTLSALAALLFAEVVRDIYFYEGGFAGLRVNQAFMLAYNAVFIAFPVLLGSAVRSSRGRLLQLAEQARELQRERQENARRAVLEERVRIARELHDVVAHHVSVMGVQAGAARRVLTREPEKAAEALASIESSSRQAVDELHHLLGFLRADQTDALAPQPDLGQLPDLVSQCGTGPLTIELIVEGDRRPLPSTLEVSVYRVIQEALTNAVKHSHGTGATVRIAYRPRALDIDVHDNGTGDPDPQGGGGHGLIGMRERVRLHGGRLRAGPLPGGGFAVHASFPCDV